MGDELRGENLVHLNVRFSTETELKKIQDFLYEKSGQGVSFTGLVEAMANEVTIVTAVHNIKSNKGSRTAGVDKMKMDKYLQMPKDELILLIQSSFRNYRPKPARREYIEKSNGKKRPLGIPTVLDRIIQECVRIIIEPICEARFYPQSYGFRPYRAQKHAIRGIINVINAGCKSPDQPVWAIEGDIKGCDRPSVNSPNDIAISAYAKGRMNFEYYMNREYAYSRDKGKCKCCGNAFSPMLQKNCHHVKNKLPLDRINKVPNLVWLCEPCHRMVHNSPIPPELDAKTVGKIMKYREKLKL